MTLDYGKEPPKDPDDRIPWWVLVIVWGTIIGAVLWVYITGKPIMQLWR